MYFKLDIISKNKSCKPHRLVYVRTDVAINCWRDEGGQAIICMKLSDRSLVPHGAELL